MPTVKDTRPLGGLLQVQSEVLQPELLGQGWSKVLGPSIGFRAHSVTWSLLLLDVGHTCSGCEGWQRGSHLEGSRKA